MSVLVWAPSNIAWVKYMGKKPGSLNEAENPSFSMTLDRLRTWVELEWAPARAGETAVEWLDELPRVPGSEAQGLRAVNRSETAQEKVYRHYIRVVETGPALFRSAGLAWQALSGQKLILRTANTFPEASGIASSASSFAALSLGFAAAHAADSEAFWRVFESQNSSLRLGLARLARRGSGSAGRSLMGPYVSWDGADGIESVESTLPELVDCVLLAGAGSKEVSSSQAHQRVRTSPLWQGRVERAVVRHAEVIRAVRGGDWSSAVRLAWQDSWEMHSLFHTAEPPFSYWRPESVAFLQALAPLVKRGEVLVTQDAGPHLHVLMPASQQEQFTHFVHKILGTGTQTLWDKAGRGAQGCHHR